MPATAEVKETETEQEVPRVEHGFVPAMLTVRPGEAESVKVTESAAKPGNPFMAVAVTTSVLGTPGNSGPKLVLLADTTTEAMVADAELSKVVPV